MIKAMIATLTVAAGIPIAMSYSPVATAVEPTEEDPGWSCVTDGNHVCGPNNDEGKPAGRYDDGGVMVESWAHMLGTLV